MKKQFCTLLLLLLTACEEPQKVNGQYNNGALYILHNIVVTHSEGSSLGSYLTAETATGDNNAIIMDKIHLTGKSQQPFELKAPQGTINPQNMNGTLTGGIILKWGSDYQATTAAAQLNSTYLLSNDEVHVQGPALDVLFDGASFNRISGQISSIGEVSGEILPTTL